jgi:ABC-type branched-subunit amino acid transport system substrate-binding protein
MKDFVMRWAVVIVAALLGATPARAQEVRIGAVFPLSGPNASYGDIFMSGANLAMEHANADRVLAGKLVVQYEDSQALPQQGVIGMNKLVNVAKVPFVLSAFTGVSKAISTIAQRTKTVTVNGGAVGPDLAELGSYFWNVIPLANYEVRASVPYLIKERGLKRVVLVYVDDPLGQGIKKELESIAPAAGGQLVEALSVPATAQQFSGIAARVRDSKPELIYVASYGAQQLQMIKQFRDNGVTQQLASYSAFSIPEINAMPEALGALYTTQNVDWSSSDPVTKRFVDDYKAKHGKMPTAYVANYYNAVRLFALLARDLQKKGKPITGENLLAQRDETKTFELVGGKVTFQPNGTVVAPLQVNEVDGKGGKVVASKR